MISLLLQASLDAGVQTQALLAAQDETSYVVTHESLKYSFFVALESETSSDRFYAVLCKSATSYSNCNSQATKCGITNNTRSECKLNQTGEYTLFIKNTGNTSARFYVVYDDSILVSQVHEYQFDLSYFSASKAYFRIPICHNKKNFTIETSNNVYYSFATGRPITKLTEKELPPNYPGFLYLMFNDTNIEFKVYQFDIADFGMEKYETAAVAAWKGCDRLYGVPSPGKGQMLTVAASEIDDILDAQVDIYYTENFTGSNYPNSTNNDGFGVQELFETTVSSDAGLSIISIQMPQKQGYLPHWYSEQTFDFIYNYIIYVTSKNTGLLPGGLLRYDLDNRDLVIAIPFASSVQALQVEGKTKSNYVIRMVNAEDAEEGNATLQFGHASPDDNSFEVMMPSEAIYESSANYTDHNDYENDLFFATIFCKKVKCMGDFRAEHSYKLEPRLQINFAHTSWEGVKDMYYMHYDLGANGIDLKITQYEDITVIMSEKEMLPEVNGSGILKFNCEKGTICHIQEKDGLEPNLDVHIAIAAQKSLSVTAADIGDNIIELKEATPALGYVYFGNNSTSTNYIFDPNYYSYSGEAQTKEEVLFNFELVHQSAEDIPSDVSIALYVSASPNPDKNNHIIRKTISQGELKHTISGENITTVQMIVPTPFDGELYYAVFCEGGGCQSGSGTISRREFRVTAYTTEQMQIQSPDKYALHSFNARTTTIQEYFSLTDEQSAKLVINFDDADNCTTIDYDVYVCMGALATLGSIDKQQPDDYCFFYQKDEKINLEIELDSSYDKVSAGNVYVTFVPHFTHFIGDKNYIDTCRNDYRLYLAEEISDFQEPFYGELYETGILNGIHIMAKVPAIEMFAVPSEGKLGDRLIVKVESTNNLRICISDILDNFYPSPLNRDCINTNSGAAFTNTEFAVLFKNYLNQKTVGNIVPHTNVYMSIWTEDTLGGRNKCKFNITIAPQAVLDPLADEFPTYFIAKQYNGLDRYINYLFNISSLPIEEKVKLAFTVGPFCNDSYCRSQNRPEEFYEATLITTVSTRTMLPTGNDYEAIFYNKGPTLFDLFEALSNTSEISKGLIYITLEYRKYNTLTQANRRSPMPYQVDVIQGYDTEESNIDYQTTTTRNELSGSTAVMDYYHSELSYIPSEIVIYPCRGRPAVLLDSISPLSSPENSDYEVLVANDWGRTMYFQYFDSRLSQMQSFITVFDWNAFDFEKRKFITDSSVMEYQIFVGSQAQQTRPGNQGTLTVVKFSSSGKGKLTVKFTPAAVPFAKDDVSSVNYRIFAVPYSGSFDEQNDYSPYTACGVEREGYSIYKNSKGDDFIEYSVKDVSKHGYIEVTSNENLWDAAPPGSILYITVIADNVAYTGILAGQEAVDVSTLMWITYTVVILVILALLGVFWGLFIRLRKQKVSGYKPVTA